MDPEEKKKNENLVKNISEMKSEGVDILMDEDRDRDIPTKKPETESPEQKVGSPAMNQQKQEGPNLRTIADSIPNVINKPDESKAIERQKQYNSAPVTPGAEDKLNSSSNKLISSVPIIPREEIERILSGGTSGPAKERTVPAPYEISNKKPIDDPSIKALRTYKTDAEEAIKNQRMSVVNIAVAESEKKEKVEKAEVVQKQALRKEHGGGSLNILPIVLSIIFVCAGIGAGYFFYKFFSEKTTPIIPVTEIESSLVKEDSVKEFDITKSQDPLESFVNSVKSVSKLTVNTIVRLKPVIKNEIESRESGASEFWRKSSYTIPGRLLRTLTLSIFGVHEFEGTTPFIVLQVSSFENGFAGMLEWEKTMPQEFTDFIALSKSSSSEGAVFYDRVIKNKDVRILQNQVGENLLYYTFVNTNTIIITTKQKTLEMLIDRLVATRVVK